LLQNCHPDRSAAQWRERTKELCYSSRKIPAGSAFAARCAGTREARRLTTNRVLVTEMRVAGSAGLTSKRRLRKNCVRPANPTSPKSTPRIANLPGPLRDRECDQPIQPEGCKPKSYHSENAQHLRFQPRPCDGIRNHLPHQLHFGNPLIRNEPAFALPLIASCLSMRFSVRPGFSHSSRQSTTITWRCRVSTACPGPAARSCDPI
jgi:hypothetical protein